MIPACRAGCSGSNPDRGASLPLCVPRTRQRPLNLGEGVVGPDAAVEGLGGLIVLAPQGSAHGLNGRAAVLAVAKWVACHSAPTFALYGRSTKTPQRPITAPHPTSATYIIVCARSPHAKGKIPTSDPQRTAMKPSRIPRSDPFPRNSVARKRLYSPA